MNDLEKLYNHYREGDTQYQIAGGTEGITQLANAFYDQMETLPEAKKILHLHPTDLTESRDKLSRFLCGYLNGPNLYKEKYGAIALAPAHAHLPIGTPEMNTWLLCMEKALEQQPYPQAFKDFLLKRLAIPADRCRNQP